MTSIGEDFSLSDADRLALAVVDVLRSDGVLMAWTAGSIRRASVVAPIPEEVPPQIVVGAQVESEEFRTGGCSELRIPIGILIYWEDQRRALEDGEPTVVSVLSRVKGLLLDKQKLMVPRFGMDSLTKRLDRYQSLDLGGSSKSGNLLQRYVVLVVEYLVEINAYSRRIA